jgi:polyphosphate glucokinase
MKAGVDRSEHDIFKISRELQTLSHGGRHLNVLVIDVGGTHIKLLASRQTEPREFPSGPTMTPRRMVSGVKKVTADWEYEVVSMGYPGPVLRNRPVADPYNLGAGWMGFHFAEAFGRPLKLINDAAMQALGSYKGGKLLFLGLGTGLGSAMVVDGIVEPMELGHLPYKKATYEDYVGLRGLEDWGKKKWRRHVADVVARLIAALEPDDVVLGGGNVKKLKELPPGCRAGDNANAFLGGFRLWDEAGDRILPLPHKPVRGEKTRRKEYEDGNCGRNKYQKPSSKTPEETSLLEGSPNPL